MGAGETAEAEVSESAGEVGERGVVSADGKDGAGTLEDHEGVAIGGGRPEGWGALTLDACVNANP